MAEEGNATLEEPPSRMLETERLRLRTLRVSDAEAILPILSRIEVMQWTTRVPQTTVDQATQWLSARALGADVFNFAITLRSDHNERPAIIGVAGCFHPPKIGYILHPDHFGKGYATEAMRAILPALFDHMPPASEGGTGFDYLEGWIDTKNVGSQRVLEKLGFTYCETFDGDFVNPSMGVRDSAVYRIARPGKTLEELGLLPMKAGTDEEERFVPPIE